MMPATPQAPIATNQPIITGPNRPPTAPVPWRCTANSATMITAVTGTTQPAKPGSITLRPSTADSTEIAGVIMLSPENSAAPRMPSAASTIVMRLPGAPHRRTRATSAMIPPSPSLSARITSVTYVSVTMIITDQKISDTTPYTLSVVIGTGWGSV